MLRQFRLEEPESVKEASESLARYGDSAKVYAGGTELLLAMKEGSFTSIASSTSRRYPAWTRSRTTTAACGWGG